MRQCNLNNLRDNKKFEEELISAEVDPRVSGFQGFRVSGFQGFRVSGFQGFRVSGFQEFRNSGILILCYTGTLKLAISWQLCSVTDCRNQNGYPIATTRAKSFLKL